MFWLPKCCRHGHDSAGPAQYRTTILNMFEVAPGIPSSAPLVRKLLSLLEAVRAGSFHGTPRVVIAAEGPTTSFLGQLLLAADTDDDLSLVGTEPYDPYQARTAFIGSDPCTQHSGGADAGGAGSHLYPIPTALPYMGAFVDWAAVASEHQHRVVWAGAGFTLASAELRGPLEPR